MWITFLKTDAGMNCCELKGTVPVDGKESSLGVGGGVRKDDPELKARTQRRDCSDPLLR